MYPPHFFGHPLSPVPMSPGGPYHHPHSSPFADQVSSHADLSVLTSSYASAICNPSMHQTLVPHRSSSLRRWLIDGLSWVCHCKLHFERALGSFPITGAWICKIDPSLQVPSLRDALLLASPVACTLWQTSHVSVLPWQSHFLRRLARNKRHILTQNYGNMNMPWPPGVGMAPHLQQNVPFFPSHLSSASQHSDYAHPGHNQQMASPTEAPHDRYCEVIILACERAIKETLGTLALCDKRGILLCAVPNFLDRSSDRGTVNYVWEICQTEN